MDGGLPTEEVIAGAIAVCGLAFVILVWMIKNIDK
jgi:hypothetical protein